MEGPKGVRKGAWTSEEDNLLRNWVERHGEGRWHLVPSRAGLNRCRKSCRLRWLNYLKPNINRGEFAEDEVDLMIKLHKLLGNRVSLLLVPRWSLISGRLPGRTANDIKNFWNTRMRKNITYCEEDAKPKTPNAKKTNIIRPQPWKFKNMSSTTVNNAQMKLLPEPHGSNTHQNVRMVHGGGVAPADNSLCEHSMAFPLPRSYNEDVCEKILDKKEINQFNGSATKPFAEENATGTDAVDTFFEEGQMTKGMNDFYEEDWWIEFSSHIDLWKLLNEEQETSIDEMF
ncbi:hypothetical protein GH714_003537 [Hevea brasiliensis]|uniref:Uncharacterized protein n=1 Tax=Hevea brasiliensis TaxID=3981 RepID=A0A6A6KIS2_HEVBR|nr:transcription factor MYB90 isoform X1 [Hevea brasiliensis]KAF2287963.1 hypothetical protein GH714_003537 [Hevea brasiliensis]